MCVKQSSARHQVYNICKTLYVTLICYRVKNKFPADPKIHYIINKPILGKIMKFEMMVCYFNNIIFKMPSSQNGKKTKQKQNRLVLLYSAFLLYLSRQNTLYNFSYSLWHCTFFNVSVNLTFTHAQHIQL